MSINKEWENQLQEAYKQYISCDENIPLTYEEWKKVYVTECLSCKNLILIESFDILETEDGYYCGSCRP